MGKTNAYINADFTHLVYNNAMHSQFQGCFHCETVLSSENTGVGKCGLILLDW